MAVMLVKKIFCKTNMLANLFWSPRDSERKRSINRIPYLELEQLIFDNLHKDCRIQHLHKDCRINNVVQ